MSKKVEQVIEERIRWMTKDIRSREGPVNEKCSRSLSIIATLSLAYHNRFSGISGYY